MLCVHFTTISLFIQHIRNTVFVCGNNRRSWFATEHKKVPEALILRGFSVELVIGLEPMTCALRKSPGTVRIAIYSGLTPFLLSLLAPDFSFNALFHYGFPFVNGQRMVIKSIRKNTNTSREKDPNSGLQPYPCKYFTQNNLKAFVFFLRLKMLDLSVNLWYVLYKNERGPFKMTIPELLRKTYEFDYECNRFLDSSYNRKLYTVGIVEKSNLANIPIEEITKDDLNRFLASITDYSNSTIAKIYVCLKESFVLAKLDGIIDENPFDNIRAFRLPKSNKPDKKVSAFTVDEEKAFLNALNDEYTRPTHGNWYRHQFLIALHT